MTCAQLQRPQEHNFSAVSGSEETMLFWVGTLVAAAALLIGFAITQKTFAVRLVLLILGMIGLGLTCYRYYSDRSEAQRQADYWEVARLNMLGVHFVGGDLVEHSGLNDILGAHVQVGTNDKMEWSCDPAAIDAYGAAIKYDAKFPFSYFLRASCNSRAHVEDWQRDVDAARAILVTTTHIPGHNLNHDQVLKMIDSGNLGRPASNPAGNPG